MDGYDFNEVPYLCAFFIYCWIVEREIKYINDVIKRTRNKTAMVKWYKKCILLPPKIKIRKQTKITILKHVIRYKIPHLLIQKLA